MTGSGKIRYLNVPSPIHAGSGDESPDGKEKFVKMPVRAMNRPFETQEMRSLSGGFLLLESPMSQGRGNAQVGAWS